MKYSKTLFCTIFMATLIAPVRAEIEVAPAASTVGYELQKLADLWGWEDNIGHADLVWKISQKYGFTMLDPMIKEEVRNAFKACNITEPIIVLQDNHSTDSACYKFFDKERHPVKVMVIGVSDAQGYAPIPYIRHSIFHECGHIVAGDLDKQLENVPAMLANLGLSTYVGISAKKALENTYFLHPHQLALGAGLATFFALKKLCNKTVDTYKSRGIERNADIFAIKKLMELDDYHTIAHTFLNLTYLCDEKKINYNNEYWLFHDHPGYRERAQIILDTLITAQIDLHNLPINEQEYPDKQGTQQRFIEQIAKHFPEYVKSE